MQQPLIKSKVSISLGASLAIDGDMDEELMEDDFESQSIKSRI